MPRSRPNRNTITETTITEAVETVTSNGLGMTGRFTTAPIPDADIYFDARASEPPSISNSPFSYQPYENETELLAELVEVQALQETDELERIEDERRQRNNSPARTRRSTVVDNSDFFGRAVSSISIEREEDRPRRDLSYLQLDRVSIESMTGAEANDAFRKFDQSVQHRLNWIFRRQEREGFRRHYCHGGQPLPPFSLDELMVKLKKPNPLNTETSQFYDWMLNSPDFILRLEYFTRTFEQDQDSDYDFERTRHYLRVWYILKESGKTLGYTDRLWNGSEFKAQKDVWAAEE